MGKGIEIGVGVDTKAAKQGLDAGLIAPLEDAQEALDDLGKSKGLDKLEDGFRDAQKASGNLQKETKETADTIEREFRKSYADMKQSSSDGTSRAKEDLAELKNEALQNASETFSSFDGSAQSFIDGIQGTLGGVVSSMGPIGAAAGAAGALGIGLIMAAVGQAEEDTEAFREKVKALADDLMDAGEGGEVSIGYIVDQLRELATEGDGSKVSLASIRKEAERLNLPFKDLANTYAGGTDKIEEQRAAVEKLIDAEEDRLQKMNEGRSGTAVFWSSELQALTDQRDALGRVADATAEARQQEADWIAAGGPEMEAKAARIAAIDDAYDSAAENLADFLDKETGLFNTEAYLASMAEREKAILDYQNTLATSGLSAEAKSFLDSQGIEAASSFLAGYKKATPPQQAELNRIWSTAASENSGTYVEKIGKAFGTPVKGPKVEVTDVDLSNARGQISRFVNEKLSKTVVIDLVTRNGTPVR